MHNSLAALRGWLGERTEFVRTPKYGEHANTTDWARTAYARPALHGIVAVEVAMLLFLLVGIAGGLYASEFGFVPIQVMGVLGLGWLVGLALAESLRVGLRRRAASPEAAVELEVERDGRSAGSLSTSSPQSR